MVRLRCLLLILLCVPCISAAPLEDHSTEVSYGKDDDRVLVYVFDFADTADPNDYAEFRSGAAAGDPNSQYYLALYHFLHTEDMNEVTTWLRSAALQDHAKSQFALGNSYWCGQGVPEDRSEALSWYRKAANLGHLEAQYRLGCLNRDGDGVETDHAVSAKWFLKAAKGGYAWAQYDLGEMYAEARGVERDAEVAAKWFRKAAEQGHAEAQCRLAVMYDAGEGVPKDGDEAVKWFLKAAEQGHKWATFRLKYLHPEAALGFFFKRATEGVPNAQYELGCLYRRGNGVSQDYRLAVEWLTRAAEQGHRFAQKELAGMYYAGDGVAQDFGQAAEWYRRAAEADDWDAYHRLGVMHLFGQGVSRDAGKAVEWLAKAADEGDIQSQILLGFIYSGRCDTMSGERTVGSEAWHEENLHSKARAESWFRKPESSRLWSCVDGSVARFHKLHHLPSPQAEPLHDNASTAYLLGILYHSGWPGPKDLPAAASWFTVAAKQGLVQAQAMLGAMYEDGEGVPQDKAEAAKWYMKAAQEGLAEAQYRLSSAYDQGDGVPQSDEESVYWCRKAAEQNHGRAQAWLGMCFMQCWNGVLENYTEAYKWFLLAESNGSTMGKVAKKRLRDKMTPAQIAEAQRAAKAFLREQRRGGFGEREQNSSTTATGFFLTSSGYLLTASHAIDEVARVDVIHNSQTCSAHIVLQDESTDVAILKIEGSGFPCLPLASSATTKAGDSVFTMGFPQVQVQGSEAKFTEGSISALSGYSDSPRFFQISVPIQPGNSGGPLLNDKGEVIGVIVSRLDDVTALLATGAIPQSVNYAVKSSFIMPLIESVSGLPEKLPETPVIGDRAAAIERAKEAIVLVRSYTDSPLP